MPLGVEDARMREATTSPVSDTEQRRADGTGVDCVVGLGLTDCSSAGAKDGTGREAQASQTGQQSSLLLLTVTRCPHRRLV